MKCIECGHELKDGAIFCIRCGAMQVSMDGSRLEGKEWPDVEPQGDGSAWRSADGGRPSVNAQHSRDFTPAPKRGGGGRIAAIIIAIIVVIAIVVFALVQCMGPATSGSDASATTAATSSSDSASSSTSTSSTSASSASTSASSASASASAASASASASASAASTSTSTDTTAQQTESTPAIVGEQTQTATDTTSTVASGAPTPSYGDYVLAESSSRAYTQSELEAYSAADLYYARNEIFARHGRMFQHTDLQNYFNSKDWYTPLYTPEQWSSMGNQLSDVETANANLIKQVEVAKGSPYV